MSVTPSGLRQDLYRYLDEVLTTGEPLEIVRDGRILRIVAAEEAAPYAVGRGKLGALIPRDVGVDDPLALAEVGWSDAWSPDGAP